MKNIKLRLATTLSLLAMVFSGSALANDWQPGKDFQAKKNRTLIAKTIKTPVVAQKIVKQPLKNRILNNRLNNQSYTYVQPVTKTNYKSQTKKVVPLNVYSIRSGDTLYAVSLRTGVSMTQLIQLNHLSHGEINSLRIGRVLKLG